MLSLQVHPGAEQAAAVFAAEDAAGIALDAPERRYKDVNAESELVVALGPFRALAGIRDPAVALDVVEAIGVTALTEAFSSLRTDCARGGVMATLRGLLQMPRADAAMLVAEVVTASAMLGPADEEAVADWASLVPLLAAAHPGDVGVLAALLLKDVTLHAGRALFQPTGSLHAYVSGLAVEVMLSSDNILRGGLTSTHVDIQELLAVVDAAPWSPIRRDLLGPMAPWGPATGEFVLHQLRPGGGSAIPNVTGPAVIMATEGRVHVTAEGVRQELTAGQAVLAPAAEGIGIAGTGTSYLASCVVAVH